MKKRILLLLTVVALMMVAMMVVMAAPAFARINCEGGSATDDYLFCRGGEGSQGGGFGTRLAIDYTQPGYYSVSILGSGDGSGGGAARATS
jgi:hypothetical protein